MDVRVDRSRALKARDRRSDDLELCARVRAQTSNERAKQPTSTINSLIIFAGERLCVSPSGRRRRAARACVLTDEVRALVRASTRAVR